MLNSIEQQMIQHEKESYIADHITKRLLCEKCTQQEYRDILKVIEERILGKGVYDGLECDEKDTLIFEPNVPKLLDSR